MNWLQSTLDIVLILIVGAGLVQVTRLIGHLIELRKNRADMERFVQEFNTTVQRAEAGIKGLRNAARDSGDDLEKLVEKALQVRDELQFITESADQVADRLSQSASSVMRPESAAAKTETSPSVAPFTPRAKVEIKETPVPASRAEKELLQALQKLN